MYLSTFAVRLGHLLARLPNGVCCSSRRSVTGEPSSAPLEQAIKVDDVLFAKSMHLPLALEFVFALFTCKNANVNVCYN